MELAQGLQQLGQQRFAELFDEDKVDPKIMTLLSLSDFAFRILEQHPNFINYLQDQTWLATRHTPEVFQQSLETIDEGAAFQALREYRNLYWLKLAYLDLVDGNDIRDSISYTSQLSETLIDSAYRWAYAQVASVWGKPIDSDGLAMPMLILGMGKLGGFELNYSSDIDLIFTYPYQVETQGGRKSCEAQVFFTKVAQKTIAALNQVTPEGQVFRVDMRLRPFGDSGPLVMSFNAMEEYYQEQGRDWERYAMLKARLLGSESSYWQQFYDLLRPFVYRKYIDFSVIESLRKMKALIAQDVRRKGLTENIKLGAGGIREAEFVVQALQMIRGGREPSLQVQSFCSALEALAELNEVPEDVAATLTDGYLFLRRIEQYLQQFDDKQTQTLPQDELGQQRLSALLGKQQYADTIAEINAQMAIIHTEFNAMIGSEEDDEQEVDSRYELLWEKPSIEVISSHQLFAGDTDFYSVLHDFKVLGSKRKLGGRGRDVLDKLMPKLLQQADKCGCQPSILKRVLAVIEKVISRTAYLELLLENPGALNQLFKLCAHSKWIGDHLACYPILLDELIDPAQLYRTLPLTGYEQEIRQYFLRIDENDLEMQMEALRQFKQTHQLKIAAADATGVLDVMKVSDHLTALSEAIVSQCVNLAWQQMVARFGYPPAANDDEKGFAVIAYGKAGGIELGYDSDLDLVFVHNSDGIGQTNGDKQIDARQFYLKLAQRLLHLFNTRTASGILYELDTRLRPEGASGLLAINIETYREYQLKQAWTWEHQALVRARMTYGQTQLQERFKSIRKEVLSLTREQQKLKDDVVNMRQKMRDHLMKGDEVFFDIKQGLGGMADIEFLAQYFVLANAHQQPLISEYSDNIRIFERAAELGLIEQNEKLSLTSAYCELRELYHQVSLRQEAKLVSVATVQDKTQAIIAIWQKYLA
ncbi:bifunctional [glutamate--ammonia ligase]-adenylyl-L-tyrosine phosphorylase/[glutamate--ammonia-ligase] adenylyltransferase [Pseudoalteromonas sp. G4]|uniref:bifunctional [glutamate--ammonia ligase]-adenylyl-L-tyrosine phosphorylase/[glutamate--ammonia-ligase] adenylyltransferase n=1 Tax=Pseudoalteromonas sp. G4 TaxID=2992761 RepID=UPI00237E38A9|nr:bifunctional [glutamate--ammonia ligase]-adenylyl-L-tyrosine phosphorylase/[glutamate--ammonia-ligase] adenylyltransferase [Pseudoalteromonas sp. G4]MDE3272229.1 bifunctional [glutamate--ammonia ligase]-adenylyl-L-tyrosine phosphorylase/[glutamate--ammonia-ligase] adenylyltransferase [Pseudoalteromonas sp. G4]